VPVLRTTNARLDFRLDRSRVLCLDEVRLRGVVVDETTGLPAGIQGRHCRLALELWKHLSVMLVAKYVKLFSRIGTLSFLVTSRFWLDLGPATPRICAQFLAH
jgi:hypothetical protein